MSSVKMPESLRAKLKANGKSDEYIADFERMGIEYIKRAKALNSIVHNMTLCEYYVKLKAVKASPLCLGLSREQEFFLDIADELINLKEEKANGN